MKDIYDFYCEISFKKTIIWAIYTFIWIIMAICFFSGIGTCSFDAVIDRTNKYIFYLFWVVIYAFVYIYMYIQVFKKNSKILKCCALCFVSILIVILLFLGTLKMAIFSFREFSLENWTEYKHERVFMLDDLVENNNIIGMNTGDIKKLLGKPDNYDINEPITDKKDAIYWSGNCSIVFMLEDNKITNYVIS